MRLVIAAQTYTRLVICVLLCLVSFPNARVCGSTDCNMLRRAATAGFGFVFRVFGAVPSTVGICGDRQVSEGTVSKLACLSLISWRLCELTLICNGQGLVWVLTTIAGERVPLIPGRFTCMLPGESRPSLPAQDPEHYMDERNCKPQRTTRKSHNIARRWSAKDTWTCVAWLQVKMCLQLKWRYTAVEFA